MACSHVPEIDELIEVAPSRIKRRGFGSAHCQWRVFT
jgi:hypothetical protein